MNKNIQQYIVGQPYPQWFREKMAEGKVKIYKDEDGNLEYVTVTTPTKVYSAYPGDKILCNSRGMVVKNAKEGGNENVQK